LLQALVIDCAHVICAAVVTERQKLGDDADGNFLGRDGAEVEAHGGVDACEIERALPRCHAL
jgi:hypothetical protein